jgi:thiol-disulfide isomerase/thioredoxin
MRRIWVAALALAVVVSVNRADDKAKTDAPPGAAKTPAQQFADLEKQFNTDFRKILTEFRDAKDDDRAKVQERAFKLAPDYAKKFMELVEANPKDPIAAKSLMWIATVSGSRGVPPPPQAKDAFDRLIRDYLDSPAMADLCPLLEGHPEGEKALRKIREQNPSKLVKALAALSLASILGENPKPTPSQMAEAESLFAKAIEEAKGIKGFPEERLREAEGSLFEIRHLSVGKSAPELESADLDGKKVKLSDLKGKVVVLDIWTTWCGPCKAMIPHERELVKKLEGKPFVFVSISADAEKDELTKFIEKNPMPWTHWWNGARGGILEKWNVKFFPTIYVIDAKGTIRFKNVRATELDEAVETLVKETEQQTQK